MPETEFRVMWPYRLEDIQEYKKMDCPRTVPWAMVGSHEKQAQANHGQTLKRLNERGGLDPGELVAVLTGVCWSKIRAGEWGRVTKLKTLVAEYIDAEEIDIRADDEVYR